MLHSILKFFGIPPKILPIEPKEPFNIGDPVYLIHDPDIEHRTNFFVHRKYKVCWSYVLKTSCMCWEVKDEEGDIWVFREDGLTKNKNEFKER